MGKNYPNYPGDTQDGDEPSFSPNKTHKSILGVERGSHYTRRIETDSENNVFVNVAHDTSKSVDVLHTSVLSSIAANTPTAFTGYTAPAAKKLYKISISGDSAADYSLRKNAVVIGTRRTNLDLDADFVFDQGLNIAFGDVIDAVVEHVSIGHTKSFNLYIYGE